MGKRLQTLTKRPVFWHLLSLGGLLVYGLRALNFAHHQRAVLDEGTYLYKGLLFAQGVYRPFQPYGPWTNHMPLSFLIPGYVQRWFGPGLRTGRYFSVALSLLLFVGVWLLVRRFAGERWAAWAVWAAAAVTAWAKVYSLAASESLAATLTVWAFVFALQERPRPWQLALAGTLGGALVLTRLNMSPVLAFLVLWVLWQHGWQAMLWLGGPALLVLLAGHAAFWPEILRLWAPWLPARWTPFLNAWRVHPGGQPTWSPKPYTLVQRFLVFVEIWQDYALVWVSLIAATALALTAAVPGGSERARQRYRWRLLVSLLALLWLLAVAHAAVSVGQNWCVDCLSVYAAFFAPLTLLAVSLALTLPTASRRLHFALVVGTILFTGLAVGIGSYRDLAAITVTGVRYLIGEETYQTGLGLFKTWTHLLHEITGWSPATARRLLLGILGTLVLSPLAVGLGIGLRRWGSRLRGLADGRTAWAAWLLLLTLLSPLPVLSGHFVIYDCTDDVLAAMERAGAVLAAEIPRGSLVYWAGGNSVVPLLYVPQIRTFPAQYNDGYNYRIGGEAEALYRLGMWNEVLAEQWRQQADVILLEKRRVTSEWLAFLRARDFAEFRVTPPVNPCDPPSRIAIYRRRAQPSDLSP